MAGGLQEWNIAGLIKQLPSGRDDKRVLLLCLAGLLAVLVCTFSLRGQFVLDDMLVLVNHPFIKNKLPIWQVFFLDQWGKPLSGEVTTYRPLMPLIWWPVWHVFPDNPFVFRLFTLLLHLAATVTIIRVGSLYIKDKWVVGLAALLFAVHPVHCEVLGSIAPQNEIVAFILCLWALYFAERKQTELIALLLLIFAVLIKESAIIFYPTLLLLFIARREIVQRRLLAMTILMAAGILVWVQLSLDRAPFLIGNMDNLSYDAQGSGRLLHGLYTIGRSIALMLAPRGLAPFHGFAAIDLSPETLLPYAILGGFALLCGGALLLWGLWQKHPVCVLGVSIFMGPLVLQSNLLVRTFAELSERWLYTPSLVVCFVFSSIFIFLYKKLLRKHLAWLGIICLAVIVLLQIFMNWKLLTAWKTNESLMAFAVKQEPAAYQSRYFHAKYLLQQDEIYEGLWYATTAAMIKREYFMTKGKSGRKKFTVLAELDAMALQQRFRLAPSLIEPQKPCAYVLESIAATANLKPTPPNEILNILAGLYGAQGYAGCFANRQIPSPAAP